MANRWLESFDYLAAGDLTKRYATVSGTAAISAGNGRNGTSSLRFVNQSGGVELSVPAQATWIVGMAFRASVNNGNQNILQLVDGSTVHVVLRKTNTGTLEVLRNTTLLATSTTALSTSTYYYLELKITISDTVGVVEMQINGSAETLTFVTGNSTNQDTRNAGNASANLLIFGEAAGLSNNVDFDDIYVNDGTGGVDDNFWGDVRIIAKSVDGAGNSAQFTPSTGSNWQNVDDATPNGDTDYNESSTVNHIDSMTTAALGVTGTVKGVGLSVYARKTDAGAGSIAPLWRISGTDYPGTGVAVPTEYVYVTQLYRVSPATSSAFTTSEIDGAEIGYKRTA